MRDITAIKVTEMSTSLDVEPSNGQSTRGTEKASQMPTLAAILACREASSGIMEHEKTILVMKEHDYAKTPDMSQLAPFFRLLSEERPSLDVEQSTGEKKPLRKGSSELFNVRQALADTRASLLMDTNPLSDHLNSMVSLQATLINQLQEQVFFKGIETSTIRREKEQLEARLERMERRLSILQKRSKHKDDQVEMADNTDPSPYQATSSSTTVQTPPSFQARPEQLSRLTRSENITSRSSRSRSSSTETVGRRHSRTSSTSLDVSHRAVKRTLDGAGTTTPSAPKKTRSISSIFISEYIVTEERYSGLGLCVPDYVENGGLPPLLEDSSCQSNVKVPTWRTIDGVPCLSSLSGDLIEDTSDESFIKRHSKPESEEKRRKRWDAQRTRDKLKRNKLLRRYMNKETQQTEKRKDKLSTFLPKPSETEQIEISNSIVVSAFGRPIPSLKPSVFSLDNFDPTTVRHPVKGRPKGSGKSSQTNNTGLPAVATTTTAAIAAERTSSPV